MAQYVEEVDEIPVFTDLVDIDSDKWSQYATFTRFPYSTVYRREAIALRKYEQKVCERSAAVLVTTEREAQLTRHISPGCTVHVIPNGVDTQYFARPEHMERGEPTITFVGDMSYFPNQEAVGYFARQVLPLIRESMAAVRFLIVGRNPGRKVRELERIPGVRVTGFVPDVRPYLAQTHVVVAPFSIAAGIQNKILEAMAFGLPVVASSRAVQGLSREAADTVAVADTPAEMAARTLDFLRNPELARVKGRDGQRQVCEQYVWSRALDDLLNLIEPDLKLLSRIV
jgi:sugar transferase (PEP-CTERM/EpsH1 system associated)